MVRAVRRWQAPSVARALDAPLVIICFKPAAWRVVDIERLRRRTPNSVLVMYLPDDPEQAVAAGHFDSSALAALGAWDVVVTWTPAQVPVLRRLGARHTEVVPFGWAPVHRAAGPVAAGGEAFDVSFVGTWDKAREAAITKLYSAHPYASILVAGNYWGRARPMPSRVTVVARNLYGNELLAASRDSRLLLNIPRPQNVGNHNMRYYEIPAMGAAQIVTAPMEAADPSAPQLALDIGGRNEPTSLQLARDRAWLQERRQQAWEAVARDGYRDRVRMFLRAIT
jgi:hypothetical protein